MVPRISVNCSRMNLTFSRSVRSRICALVSLALPEGGVLAMGEILANFSGRIVVSRNDCGEVSMKILKVLGVLVVVAGVVLLALIAPPSVHGQRAEAPERQCRAFTVLAGHGISVFFDNNVHQYLGDLDAGLSRLNDRFQIFNFDNFSFALPQLDGRGRLGVTLEELTPQLATYFGAKDGVLIASVREDSQASRAGLKAGDVITKVNNEPVGSRDDLMRLLRDVKDGGDVTIGIVRDKKESTVTVKLETRRTRLGRPAVNL